MTGRCAGKVAPIASERRPVIRSARRGDMFRSPVSTVGVDPVRLRVSTRSWRPLETGRNERWVATTRSGPDGVRTSARTATRGSSRTQVTRRSPSNRYGHRTDAGGSEATCQSATGCRLSSAIP